MSQYQICVGCASMVGLRAKNKADRIERIVQAASKLFATQSYEATHIEAIAAKAEVSVGTIYKYYQNKGDILVAIVSMEVNEVLSAGRVVVADPPPHVARAVDTLLMTYNDHALVYLDKQMWRQAMAISTQQPNSPSGQIYASLDRALRAQTCALIAALQKAGKVRQDVDCRGVGEMVFNNNNMMFIEFVKDEAMPIGRLRAALRRQNRTLVNAITA